MSKYLIHGYIRFCGTLRLYIGVLRSNHFEDQKGFTLQSLTHSNIFQRDSFIIIYNNEHIICFLSCKRHTFATCKIQSSLHYEKSN